MLEVVITKYPHGDRSRPEELGRAIIANDGTGTEDTGNYEVIIYKARYGAAVWKRGTLKRFPRLVLGPWDLLGLLLSATLMDRWRKTPAPSPEPAS